MTPQFKQDLGENAFEIFDDIEISPNNKSSVDKSEKKQIYFNVNNETTNQLKGYSKPPMKNKLSNELTDKSIETDIQNIKTQILKFESDLEKQNYGDYLWIIENWKEKIHEAKLGNNMSVFSEAFYTHKYGYKLCLRIYPIGIGEGKDTHLSVFFHVMSGEFDDMLSWPCKFDISFKISDQNSGLVLVTQSSKYENKPNSSSYRKPTGERNIGIGIPRFVELKKLHSNLNLDKNNKLFLRCTVHLNI